MAYFHDTKATFRPLDNAVASALTDFASRRNIGKSIDVGGRSYVLEHISQATSAFFRSRGISIYYRTGRSIVRISDHWAASRNNPRSRKLNCLMVGSCRWTIADRPGDLFEAFALGAGRYPYRLLAGVCGLNGFRKLLSNASD